MRLLIFLAFLTRPSLFQANQLSHKKTDKNMREAIQLHGTSAGRIEGKRSANQGEVTTA
jgi:hypothetical protein